MKIKSIQIDNYRSFGEPNGFSFDSNVLGLIGQNGIGKTNALEALSRLKFFTDEVPSVIPESAVNQNTNKNPRISIYVVFEESDLAEMGDIVAGPLGRDVHEDLNSSLHFEFDSDTRRTRLHFTGVIFNSLQYHPKLIELRKETDELLKYLKGLKNWHGNADFNPVLDLLEGSGRHFIPRTASIRQWANDNIANVVNQEWKERAKSLITALIDELEARYHAFAKVFPTIVLFEDLAEFPNSYDVDEIASWDQRLPSGQKTALMRYLTAIEMSKKDLLMAFRSKDVSARENIRSRIIKRTRSLMTEFNQHYRNNTAGIELNVGFDGNRLRFTVGNANDDGGVPWTEAIAGVRWYLSAFFELRQALKNRNVLVLVDEPAIHLHVKAQKEALSLIQGLAVGSKYVLYTTHSPYLIDKERLGDVRAVIRDGNCSYIKALSQMPGLSSHLEALTPVCEAIGYEMSDSLVPNASKTNLVVEGKTDAVYVNTMLKILGVEEKERPYVLPSSGAPSIPVLVSIFVGWGVPFVVLLDFDDAGMGTREQLQRQFGKDILENVFMVSREKGESIEDLIDKSDWEKTVPEGMDIRQFEHSKSLRATRFAEVFGSEKSALSKDTLDNFGCLFDDMGIMDYDKEVILGRDLERLGIPATMSKTILKEALSSYAEATEDKE